MPDVRGLILATGTEGDQAAVALCGGPTWALPVANRPLLAHALAGLRAAGARRAIVAAAPGSRGALPAAAGLDLDVLDVAPGTGVAGVLAAAASALDGDAVLIHHADALLVGELGGLNALPEGADAILIVSEAGTKAAPEGAPALLAGPDAVRVAVGLPAEAGLDVLLQALATAGGRVATRAFSGAWRYSGRPEALLEANRLVLDVLERRASDADLSAARIEGRVAVHPTAVVERATIRGPAVIGAGASVIDAFVGPYTAIGEDAQLEGAEIENSIVLTGARIRHVGPRIEASVIGPGATIGRDFGLPAALRLRVGRDAEVTLA